jgi:hypothetical protein
MVKGNNKRKDIRMRQMKRHIGHEMKARLEGENVKR